MYVAGMLNWQRVSLCQDDFLLAADRIPEPVSRRYFQLLMQINDIQLVMHDNDRALCD
jgi:hypothetical protein